MMDAAKMAASARNYEGLTMTLPVRQIYEDMPSILMIPVEMRHKRVEVIFFPLEVESPKSDVAVDEHGWPVGLFERLTSGWQGEPMERAPQGDYPVRMELE